MTTLKEAWGKAAFDLVRIGQWQTSWLRNHHKAVNSGWLHRGKSWWRLHLGFHKALLVWRVSAKT